MKAFELESATGIPLFEEAFNEMLPAIRALPDEQVIPVNLSIPSAVAKVLSLQERLRDLKDRIAGALPENERDLPEKVVHFAMALSHSNIAV